MTEIWEIQVEMVVVELDRDLPAVVVEVIVPPGMATGRCSTRTRRSNWSSGWSARWSVGST
jgi:hypothetical protein